MCDNICSLKIMLVIIPALLTSNLFGQLNFTVNSLADDEHCYAWDDPDTPEDESIDGICEDESHNCSLRAAIEEAYNMNSSVDIGFSVSGTINLTDGVSLPDGSNINGSGQIELKNTYECMSVDNNTTVNGLKISGAYVGLVVDGMKNKIGGLTGGNEIVGCQIGLIVSGDSNEVTGNYIGIDRNNNKMANQWGMMIVGNDNQIGKTSLLYSNKICGNFVGIQMEVGGFNSIQANYIGTTTDGLNGYGNTQGILLLGSSGNTIGGDTRLLGNIISGNTQHGIYITGATLDERSIDNFITNNIIGLSPLQDAAVPNGNGIVFSDGSALNVIDENVIAGNNLNGIYMFALYDSLAASDHVIQNNYIGFNDQSVIIPNHQNGILIQGFANSITIGSNNNVDYGPNWIIGNQQGGIVVTGLNSPKQIWFRKNIIYQNAVTNLSVDLGANLGIQPPANLSLNGITFAGTHQIANAVIDIYEANALEGLPSAHRWLGSTTTNGSGVFSFDITDPTVGSVSVTATTTATGTSSFAYYEIIAGVEDQKEIPTEFSLGQNYPNPFNPLTTIKYSILTSEFVTLRIFDMLGNEIATLVNEEKPEGNYELTWNAENLSSGIYFYVLNAGDFVQTKKLTLLK